VSTRRDSRLPPALETGSTGSLRALFHPRSVAVVGASREPGSVGFRILDALVSARFRGPVYPVNPKADYVGSIHAYPSLEAIGRPVDLAVIAVPAAVVPAAVADCGRAGVRAVIVITAGFAETGGDGVERQRELSELVADMGMRMVGPNCLGVLHTHPDVRLNASFAPRMPPRGTVGLCSQSGALGVAIIALTRRLGLGLSSFVSVGNKGDLSANHMLEWWDQDESTEVLLFYLESFGDPRHFAPVARRVGRRKPIVMVKAGRTEAGGRAASSHTAALAAAETAVEAFFRQTGILRAETLEEMFGLARALTQQPLPRGRRVAVVTNAGGPGILCVDALERSGLEVPSLSATTRATLDAFLPSAASSGNPVDMIASAGPREFRAAIEVLLRAEEIDALVVLYTPAGMFVTESVAESVIAGVTAARRAGIAEKPVFVSVVGDEEETYAIEGEGETLPAYRFPEEIGRVLGKIADYADWRASDPGVFPTYADQRLDEARDTVNRALEDRGTGWLSLEASRRVLNAAGLTVAAGGVATSPQEAATIADRVGFPVAVKLSSVELVHKTEIGGVVLDLRDAEAVASAYRSMQARLAAMGRAEAMDGALVQPMLEGAVEIMIGVHHDPVFGPLIAFGLGGIHVEILRDVAFRVAPLSDRDAAAMVREIRGFRLLEGYRGHAAADIPALEEALLRVSRLVEAVPAIREIDLNPIFALEPTRGYRVVDARVRVARV